MGVTDLKALAKEHGLKDYSKLRKAKLITSLRNNPPPVPSPAPTLRPILPAPTQRTRPPRPTRPAPPPPTSQHPQALPSSPSIRF